MSSWLRKWWNRLVGCKKAHKDIWPMDDGHGETVDYCFACERVTWRHEWNELPGGER